MSRDPAPNPGSPEATDNGCTCAVIDNHYGRGIVINGETVFWFSESCPMHGGNSDFRAGKEETE